MGTIFVKQKNYYRQRVKQ